MAEMTSSLLVAQEKLRFQVLYLAVVNERVVSEVLYCAHNVLFCECVAP